MMAVTEIMTGGKKKFEAKNSIMDDRTSKILGVRVSSTDKNQLLKEISKRIEKRDYSKPYFIITAYSENILEATRDVRLQQAFEMADQVVADGVSVAAAAEYLKVRSGDVWKDLWKGFEIGGRILRGEFVGRKVVGVKLTRELLDEAKKNRWKVFLLGGREGGAEVVAEQFRGTIGVYEPPQGIEWDDKAETKTMLTRVAKFAPDILILGFGRFKQEKWIGANLTRIRAQVVVGVGSSFDELAGLGRWAESTPAWVENMGLKWLWRAVKDPRHIRRAWNAFPVFAWKVFRS